VVVSLVDRLVKGLWRVVHDLDPGLVDGHDAAVLLERFAEGERLCAAAKTLLARRVDETGVWKSDGHRSAAELVARASGTSLGRARGVVQTAHRVARLSRTEEQLRDGRLSSDQADAIADAASEVPGAEAELLERAATDSLAGLRRHAEQVTAAARSNDDQQERYDRVHRARCLRTWTDLDGAGRGTWKTTPDVHARLMAAVRAEQDRVSRAARKEGRREAPEAYAIDALAALVGSSATQGSATKAVVMLRVDAEKLARTGSDDAEGICEIAGVGPVPVSVARAALGNDAMVKLVVTKGVDVLNVTHLGRTRVASVQTALDWLYDECAVRGCHRRVNLDWHHTPAYRHTGHTKLADLIPLCGQDHHRTENEGYTLLARGDGEYDLIPPDHQRGPP
jgi:hypothetical protein